MSMNTLIPKTAPCINCEKDNCYVSVGLWLSTFDGHKFICAECSAQLFELCVIHYFPIRREGVTPKSSLIIDGFLGMDTCCMHCMHQWRRKSLFDPNANEYKRPSHQIVIPPEVTLGMLMRGPSEMQKASMNGVL